MKLRNWKVMFVVAAFVGAMLATPALAAECTGKEELKAKCKLKHNGTTKAHIKLKRGAPETEVAFVITNGEGDPVVLLATTKKSGKARVKTNELVEGDHVVTLFIVEGRQECEREDFECDD